MFGPIKRKVKEKEDPSEKLREQEETARVYAEFVKSFQVDDGGVKTFIRGGVIDPNKTSAEESLSSSSSPTVPKSKFYKPTCSKKSLWLPPPSEPSNVRAPPVTTTTASATRPTVRTELGRGIGGIDALAPSTMTPPSTSPSLAGQRPREIDSFLEEIKRKQELLDQRKQLRHVADYSKEEGERENAKRKLEQIEAQTRGKGSIPGLVEAEETTNLYLGNLAPEITEEYLCQQFGKYGKIASVKIMYPRNDPTDGDRPGRRSLCGFCSFEERASAQVAKDALDGAEILGQMIRIGWGKAVAKPVISPTPLSVGVGALSGVPLSMSRVVRGQTSGFSDLPPDELLEQQKDMVKVKVPKDKRQRAIIDLVAQYVSEDGHPIEQALMERCGTDASFKFLNELESEEAIYYRWRVYAFSQGDSMKAWRTEPFEMFFGGSEWLPPGKEYFPEAREKKSIFSENPGGDGASNTTPDNIKGAKRLDEQTRDELEDMLRNLTRSRTSVLASMVLCLDHSEAALEIAECLTESLTIERTPVDRKIARLYLLSDLLHNSCCSRQSAWAYRGAVEKYLPEIFNHHNKVLRQLNGRLTIQAFKDRVMRVLRAWEEWSVYTPLFTKGLEATFLKEDRILQSVFSDAVSPLGFEDPLVDPEIDGTPFDNNVMDVNILFRYPYWLRELILEWNSLDLSNLERLCRRRGLSVSPEADAVSDDYFSTDFATHKSDGATETNKQEGPSYSGMRQLLIKRLIECEAYWRHRQLQNAKAFAVLDNQGDPDPITINTRDLIQSVLHDVMMSKRGDVESSNELLGKDGSIQSHSNTERRAASASLSATAPLNRETYLPDDLDEDDMFSDKTVEVHNGRREHERIGEYEEEEDKEALWISGPPSGQGAFSRKLNLLFEGRTDEDNDAAKCLSFKLLSKTDKKTSKNRTRK